MQFCGLAGDGSAHLIVAESEAAEQVVIEYDATAAGQCTHRQLGPLRRPQLAHQTDVEGSVQNGRDLPPDGDTPAGQTEHLNVTANSRVCVPRQIARQDPACLEAVPEHPWGGAHRLVIVR